MTCDPVRRIERTRDGYTARAVCVCNESRPRVLIDTLAATRAAARRALRQVIARHW